MRMRDRYDEMDSPRWEKNGGLSQTESNARSMTRKHVYFGLPDGFLLGRFDTITHLFSSDQLLIVPIRVLPQNRVVRPIWQDLSWRT